MLIVDGACRRRHHQSRSRGARRVPAEAERARARAAEAQAAAHQAARKRSTASQSSCSPTSSCPRTSSRRSTTARTGVGLFRSEFLFLNRDGLPIEDEQFEAYRAVAEGMDGKPVTIRTFDLGADKQVEGLDGLARVAPNPALGLRAVRFCLAEPRLFLTQLRAILRASHYGNVRILVPMLASAVGDRPDARDDRAGEGEPARAGRAVRFADRGRRHDRDPGRGHRDGRVPRRSSISCRSAPTTSSSTRWRSTAPTRPWRICTIRCTRRWCACSRWRSATANKAKEADRRVRRDGGRGAADAVAARPGPAQFLDASGPLARRSSSECCTTDVAAAKPSSIASAAPTVRTDRAAGRQAQRDHERGRAAASARRNAAAGRADVRPSHGGT